MRARYRYEQIEDDLIIIVDLNQGKSVTNDAENVIADLAAFFDLTARRIIYCDTMHCWDGLAVRDGKFAGFVPIGARTRDEAMERARAMPKSKWP